MEFWLAIILTSAALAVGLYLGYKVGHFFGFTSSKPIVKSLEKDRNMFKELYILSEKYRQDFVKQEYRRLTGEPYKKFDSPCQSEIDFPDESPVLD